MTQLPSLPPHPRRRRLGEKLAELLYRLRIEHSSPGRQAIAVAVGVAIGCLPTYGLHLPLCVLAARLLRINMLMTYLAAYVNNPVTALFLTFGQVQLGHWLLHREWIALSFAGLREVGPLHFGLDLMVGSAVSAVVLGAVAGLIVYEWLKRTHVSREVGGLIERTAKAFVPAGIAQWEFVRGKLRFDPLYLGLLRESLLPRAGTLVDLGCGRGIALALLAAAPRIHAEGIWPDGWPDPPGSLALVGVDAAGRVLRSARRALGQDAMIEEVDLCGYEPPSCSAILLTDVLHYLPEDQQRALLERAAGALQEDGVLLIREADAARGWRFWVTRGAERLRAWSRGHIRQRFHYRSTTQWRELLQSLGFIVSTVPMSQGTPFGNDLLIARHYKP